MKSWGWVVDGKTIFTGSFFENCFLCRACLIDIVAIFDLFFTITIGGTRVYDVFNLAVQIGQCLAKVQQDKQGKKKYGVEFFQKIF